MADRDGGGLAGGLVPSTSAVVLLLAATNLGRVPLGILLIALFGIGMAATLVAVGLGMVGAAHLGIERLSTRPWMAQVHRLVTPLAAIIVIGVGTRLSLGGI